MAGNQYANDERGYQSEFDAQRAALARRRRLAQMLQQQSSERSSNIVNPATGGRTSWLAPIAQMFQAYAGKSMGDKADAEGRTNAAAEQAAMEDALANAPQGEPAIPAQEMGPPSPDTQRMPMLPQPPANFGPGPTPANPSLGQQMSQPAAPLSGMLPQLPAQVPQAPSTPATPPSEPTGMERIPGEMSQQPAQAAQPPSPNDLLGYASKLARFGNPVANKVAERASGRAIDSMFPQPPSEEMLLRVQEMQAKRESDRQTRTDALAQRAEAAQLRSEDARLSVEQRREAARDRNATLLEMKRIGAAAAGGNGKLLPTPESSDRGNKLYRDGSGNQFEIVNGKPIAYAGDSINTTALEKEVPVVRLLNLNMKSGERLLKSVNDNPAAFGPTTMLSRAPIVGGTIRSLSYTPEEMEAQASMNKEAAEVVNRLYGAALSMREDQRAKSFIFSEDDTPEQLKAKLAAAMRWAKEKLSEQSAAARNVAGQRVGGYGGSGGWDAPAAADWGPAKAK